MAGVASLLLVGIGVLGLVYMGSFPKMPTFSVEWSTINLERLTIYFTVGLVSLLFLIVDDAVHRRLHKKHNE